MNRERPSDETEHLRCHRDRDEPQQGWDGHACREKEEKADESPCGKVWRAWEKARRRSEMTPCCVKKA